MKDYRKTRYFEDYRAVCFPVVLKLTRPTGLKFLLLHYLTRHLENFCIITGLFILHA